MPKLGFEGLIGVHQADSKWAGRKGSPRSKAGVLAGKIDKQNDWDEAREE